MHKGNGRGSIILICPVCKCTFNRSPAQMRSGVMYCDRACQQQGALVTIVCTVCGKEKVKRKTEVARSGGKYCSTACNNTGRRALGQGRGEIPVERNCLNCGELFTAYASEINRGGGKFCGPICANGAYGRGSKRRGSGGAKVYYGPSWRDARCQTLERDGNRCQDCGLDALASGDHLHVHHIILFRKFGVERHEEANDLSNLVTLCSACHMKRHPHLF